MNTPVQMRGETDTLLSICTDAWTHQNGVNLRESSLFLFFLPPANS